MDPLSSSPFQYNSTHYPKPPTPYSNYSSSSQPTEEPRKLHVPSALRSCSPFEQRTLDSSSHPTELQLNIQNISIPVSGLLPQYEQISDLWYDPIQNYPSKEHILHKEISEWLTPCNSTLSDLTYLPLFFPSPYFSLIRLPSIDLETLNDYFYDYRDIMNGPFFRKLWDTYRPHWGPSLLSSPLYRTLLVPGKSTPVHASMIVHCKFLRFIYAYIMRSTLQEPDANDLDPEQTAEIVQIPVCSLMVQHRQQQHQQQPHQNENQPDPRNIIKKGRTYEKHKGKLIFASLRTLTDENGHHYALIQHPSIKSHLHSSDNKLFLQFYPLSTLQRFDKNMLNFRFHFIQPHISCDRLSLRSIPCTPFHAILDHPDIPTPSPTTRIITNDFFQPFCIIYLDCISKPSFYNLLLTIYYLNQHTFQGFMFHNPKLTVVVCVENAEKLDREFFISQSQLEELFSTHLDNELIIYYTQVTTPFISFEKKEELFLEQTTQSTLFESTVPFSIITSHKDSLECHDEFPFKATDDLIDVKNEQDLGLVRQTAMQFNAQILDVQIHNFLTSTFTPKFSDFAFSTSKTDSSSSSSTTSTSLSSTASTSKFNNKQYSSLIDPAIKPPNAWSHIPKVLQTYPKPSVSSLPCITSLLSPHCQPYLTSVHLNKLQSANINYLSLSMIVVPAYSGPKHELRTRAFFNPDESKYANLLTNAHEGVTVIMEHYLEVQQVGTSQMNRVHVGNEKTSTLGSPSPSFSTIFSPVSSSSTTFNPSLSTNLQQLNNSPSHIQILNTSPSKDPSISTPSSTSSPIYHEPLIFKETEFLDQIKNLEMRYEIHNDTDPANSTNENDNTNTTHNSPTLVVNSQAQMSKFVASKTITDSIQFDFHQLPLELQQSLHQSNLFASKFPSKYTFPYRGPDFRIQKRQHSTPVNYFLTPQITAPKFLPAPTSPAAQRPAPPPQYATSSNSSTIPKTSPPPPRTTSTQQQPPQSQQQLIKMVSANWQHKTVSYDCLPPPGSKMIANDDVYCRLPMNQIIAFEEFQHHQQQQTHQPQQLQQPQQSEENGDKNKFLVSLSTTLHQEPLDFMNPILSALQTNPNLFPGVVLLVPVDQLKLNTMDEYITSTNDQFKEIQASLHNISCHIPILIVLVCALDFDAKTDRFAFQQIEFLASKLTSFFGNSVQYNHKYPTLKRPMYHFIVKGLDGYFDAIPQLQQVAISHYFGLLFDE